MTKRVKTWAPLVISLIALFAALGGVGWAASLISGKAIEKNSIPLNRLTKSARKALAGKQGPIGPQGLTGSQGSMGPQGQFVEVVPSGKTLVGTYAVRDQATGEHEEYATAISFGSRFSSALTTHFIARNVTPPPACPGSGTNPQATPGNLCVYETSDANRALTAIFSADFNGNASSPFGAILLTESAEAGEIETTGSWAATAP